MFPAKKSFCEAKILGEYPKTRTFYVVLTAVSGFIEMKAPE